MTETAEEITVVPTTAEYAVKACWMLAEHLDMPVTTITIYPFPQMDVHVANLAELARWARVHETTVTLVEAGMTASVSFAHDGVPVQVWARPSSPREGYRLLDGAESIELDPDRILAGAVVST